MIDIDSNTWFSICEHCNLLNILITHIITATYLERNALPKAERALNGFVLSTTRALPGTTPSDILPVTSSLSPCEMMMKQSVVGSGPIRIPGNSDSRRYLMNVVLPVEYWPTSKIIGFCKFYIIYFYVSEAFPLFLAKWLIPDLIPKKSEKFIKNFVTIIRCSKLVKTVVAFLICPYLCHYRRCYHIDFYIRISTIQQASVCLEGRETYFDLIILFMFF